MAKRIVLVSLFLMILLALVLPLSAQDTLPNTLNLSSGNGLGSYLVASNGMTLYTFKRDMFGVSNCSDQCAEAWPPYTVDSADGLSVADGIPGEVGTITRADGSIQVTYNEQPLYFWYMDEAPGDATGNGFRSVWLIVPPAVVSTFNTDEYGYILVGANGQAVYVFDNDTPGAGTSACEGGCAGAWPAVTVADPQSLVTAINIPGSFGTFDRADGTHQVTYNGRPLYYFAGDTTRGTAAGDGSGGVWHVGKP